MNSILLKDLLPPFIFFLWYLLRSFVVYPGQAQLGT